MEKPGKRDQGIAKPSVSSPGARCHRGETGQTGSQSRVGSYSTVHMCWRVEKVQWELAARRRREGGKPW